MGSVSDNLRSLAEYSKKMIAGDYDAVFEYWSDDFHSHVTERVNPAAVGTDVRGEERRFWEEGRRAFEDFEFRVDLLVESDDIIVSNWTITGKHTLDSYYGVPPSGKPVHINGTGIVRMKDGKIVEHWGGPHCPNGIGLEGAQVTNAV
jgi:predicted ester cyclase